MDGYIADINLSFIDVPNKISVIVYFTGCDIKCYGCQNEILQDLYYGKKINSDDLAHIINKFEMPSYCVFSGGDPFFQYEFLFDVINKLNKKICIYTGNEFEHLQNNFNNILNNKNVKLIKCGKYDINNLSNDIENLVSKNQYFMKKNKFDIWKKI